MHRKQFLASVGLTALATSIRGNTKAATIDSCNNALRTPPNATLLHEKIIESVYAFVIADAMGGSIENFLPEQVNEKFENWNFENFIPPTSKKDIETGKGKGNGRTTDDSINLEILINIYNQYQNHLDAYSYGELLVKQHQTKMYLAERDEIIKPVERPLWWPERYVYQRLAINNIEPRQAGIGNYINEGFQGIVLPIGAVNVGDPWRAYNECVSIGSAHTESFGIEAGAVNAAAYAVAFSPGASISDVLDAATKYAKDGTGMALADVLAAANQADDLRTFVQKTRQAVLPYLQLSPNKLKVDNIATPKLEHEHTNMARPSRVAVVENFPIALACLKFGGGDYLKTLKASLFYGRDGETIAAVSTSLLAAIKGNATVPAKLKQQVDVINKRNYANLATTLYSTAKNIFNTDDALLQSKKAVFQ